MDACCGLYDDYFFTYKQEEKQMNRFFYDIPTLEPDEKGNIEVIHKYSVGPIESLTYGITKNKEFYFEWLYPIFGDEELETDYRIISKERILKVLELEIAECKKNENVKLVEKYEEAKKIISTRNLQMSLKLIISSQFEFIKFV